MIARVTRAKSGISEYLIKGLKKDSRYTRDEKDQTISLYGDLQIIKRTEKYLNDHKNYKDNYLHITISYSREDMILLDSLSDSEKMDIKRDIVMSYIKHHTSGYDLDSEVIAYAETHKPIIKKENNKDRLEHEHIVVMMYNPLSDTKLQTAFHNNSFIDDTLQTYINKKYNLSEPKKHQREDKKNHYNGDITKDRQYFKEELKSIKSNDELIKYFNDNNIQYKEVKTKSNQYYKVINNQGNSINLRGKGFEHIHKVTLDKNYIYNEDKDLDKLRTILSSYYKTRITQIDKRRSKKTKNNIKEIYKTKSNDNENSISLDTYQQKIFYNHYQHLIKDNLKGYHIDTAKENNTKFVNKKKGIKIEDKGAKIVTHIDDKTSLKESVRLTIDIAEAKGWNVASLSVNGGSDEFKKEMYSQIADRVKLKIDELKRNEKKFYSRNTIERPTSLSQSLKREAVEKKEQRKANEDINIDVLKENLEAQRVLEYAVDKYKLEATNYIITDDNKIKNKSNRQKPKNIIDFMQKELNLTTKKAIEECKSLYLEQPLKMHTNNEEEVKTMPMKISICKDTNINALNSWEQIEVSNYTQLASIMKQYPYSHAEFNKGYRNSDNVASFNNVLIYDIDNDLDSPQLNIKEAEKLLKEQNISAMILPSKSHLKDKKGHTAERYRIVIPTNESISTMDKPTYREFQRITAKALKIDKYVDKKALNDKSRFYYKSPIEAVPRVIKSSRVMDIRQLQDRAIENIAEELRAKELERQRLNEIRANIQQYQTVEKRDNNNLTYANIDKIMQLNIKDLIKYFEKDSNEYKEGSYQMIRTSQAKYSILSTNIAHDFKSDKTFNNLTYLQHQLAATNLNIVARELESITGDSYTQINYQRIKEVVAIAREESYNDNSFEENIRQQFDVRYVKLGKDTIHIADKEIKLSDIGHTKLDIVNDLKSNREYVAPRTQAQRPMRPGM